LCIERIRKFARGKDIPASIKVDAEHRCFQIFEKTIERLQSLGLLPTATQKVTAELTYQTEQVLTLEQIDEEVKRLQQIEGHLSDKENAENEIIAQFEDEPTKKKGNQNGQA
jgi:DNA-binding ferritin-like protein